jgi:hypothetical protein
MGFESFKAPIEKVARAAENAFFNYRENPSTEEAWDALFDSKTRKFVRAQAAFTMLRSLVSDSVFERMTGGRYAYQRDVLPIDPEQYSFDEERLGGGYECNVYKLISHDPERPSLAIKINQSRASDTDDLLERGKVIRSEYEEKREWYRELPGLIPDEAFFIGKSPRGGKSAFFTVQEFMGGADNMRDMFRGINREELLGILRSDEQLKERFCRFVEITLERAREHDEMIDTLGDKNLVLVERGGRAELVVLDTHDIKHPSSDPMDADRIQADLRYLADLLRDLKPLE